MQQALFFAHLTGKKPAVIIYDTDGRIGRFEHRIKTACGAAGVEFLRGEQVSFAISPAVSRVSIASFINKHRRQQHDDSKLLKNRIHLSEVLRRRVKKDIDDKTEAVFRGKVGRDQIRFHLEIDERLDYEIGKSLEVFASADEEALQHQARPVQHSLFEPVLQERFQ